MKIVEDTPNRLVLKEGALTSRIFATTLLIAGLVGLGLAIVNRAKLHNSYLFDAIALVVAAFGGFMLATAQSDMVVADNTSRQLSVAFKSLKNRQGANQTYSFDDIQSVQLIQNYQQVVDNNMDNFNHEPGISYGGGFGIGMANTQTVLDQKLIVLLKNGNNITLAHEDKQTGLTLGFTANSLANKGQKLAAVLGVPFNQPGVGTPGQLLQGIEHGVVGQPESFVQSNNQPVNNYAPAPQQPVPSPEPMAQPPLSPTQETPPEQDNNSNYGNQG